MFNPEDPNYEAVKNEKWQAQQPLMEEIINNGAEGFFNKEKISQLKEAFVEDKDTVCCADEGTAHLEMNSKLSMAGSGILYPANSWQERLERVANFYLKLGVQEITSHDGCDGAGLAYKRDGGQKVLGDITPDAYGRKWAEELQAVMNQKLNQPGTVSYRNILSQEMVRPAEFHDARAIWFDATGKFNPDKLGDKIPHGFLIDYGDETKLAENEVEKDYPFQELEAFIGIAFDGHHGFGDKFTVENPLVVLVVAPNTEEKEKVMAEVSRRLPEKEKGRIKVDGFVK